MSNKLHSQAWSVAGLAKAADYTPDTIRRLCRTGKIPAIRIGRDYRIEAGAAAAFVQGRPMPTSVEVNGGKS